MGMTCFEQPRYICPSCLNELYIERVWQLYGHFYLYRHDQSRYFYCRNAGQRFYWNPEEHAISPPGATTELPL